MSVGAFWGPTRTGTPCKAVNYQRHSYQDDGATVSGIDLGSTNFPGAFSSAADYPVNNQLLDTYCYFGAGGTAFVFTGVPNGTYNLAIYGIDGAYEDRGTVFTVNGVSQPTINVQDTLLGSDNTVIFTNVPVSHGSLEVDMMPVAVLPLHNPNTEGDFNGAQIQLVAYPPEPPISITFSDGLCHLSWRGGRLLQATNILGALGNKHLGIAAGVRANRTDAIL